MSGGGQDRKQTEQRDRADQDALATEGVGEASTEQRTGKQAQSAGAEERAQLLRCWPELCNDATRRDARGLEIEAFAEGDTDVARYGRGRTPVTGGSMSHSVPVNLPMARSRRRTLVYGPAARHRKPSQGFNSGAPRELSATRVPRSS